MVFAGGDRYDRGDRGHAGGYGSDYSRSRQAWRQGDWVCDGYLGLSAIECYADQAPERDYSSRGRGYSGGGKYGNIGGKGNDKDYYRGSGGKGAIGVPVAHSGNGNCPDWQCT